MSQFKNLTNYKSLDIIAAVRYVVVGFVPIEERKNKLHMHAKEKNLNTFFKKKQSKSFATLFDKKLSLTFGYHFFDKTALLSQGQI